MSVWKSFTGVVLFVATVAALPLVRASVADDNGVVWVEVRSAHFLVASNAGEGAARGVAEDFEQIRGLFHSTFPELRVDPAQPIVIFAARDEATMRMITPDEFGGADHVRPSGSFHSDGDNDYVVLRLDSQGATAFHTIYHEYTHALLHLNFRRIPLWLNEGLAEFFGNSTFETQEAQTGTVDKNHLFILGKNEWLPMETLLTVNESSSYYNEKNPASVFYAESWVVVHYLLLDPEARKKQILKKFLVDWDLSGDGVTAAHQAFGDLGAFGETVKKYVRDANWRVGVVLPGAATSAGDMTVRTLAPAEVLALRGDFFAHRKMSEPARALLEQAVALGPEMAVTHEAMGFYDFREGEFAAAEHEMSRAIELGSQDFMAFYCRGVLLLRDFSESAETTVNARAALEQAERLNPMYAPTFEGLTQVYSRLTETQGKALVAAETAVKLDPESDSYKANLAYVLLNNGKVGQARVIAERLLAKSGSTEDTRMARSILAAIEEEEQWERESASLKLRGEQRAAAPDSNGAGAQPVPRRQLGPPEWMAVEGAIAEVECGHAPEVTLRLNLPNGPVDFHAADFGKVGVSGVSAASVPGIENCREWSGRRVKIWFRPAGSGKDYFGEIIRVYFY
jgi:tetratricopeptide (TPR) repeat protein